MKFLSRPTRILFFTGKGGVGKTSVACATAVQLADSGKKVLLVSTDPASNLDEVLGANLTNRPQEVSGAPGLFAMNLDPAKAAYEYRERMVSPYRGLLPDAAIKSMEEQFSGSCTLEIAAFDEFSRLLGDAKATEMFDHVIFDTAPTGHTLRLLTLPSAWSGYLQHNTSGTSCLGPLAGLQAQQSLYQKSVEALSDASKTTLVLVARGETSTLTEAARTSAELASLGINNQYLVVNGVFRAIDPEDPYAVAHERRSQDALLAMPASLKTLPCTTISLSPHGIIGIDALRDMGRATPPIGEVSSFSSTIQVTNKLSFPSLIDELAVPGHGVILTMGKGGVGKTTVAGAIAVALAQRGFNVHLSTTDPAAHITDILRQEQLPNLKVDRIDPVAETARYSAEVMTKAGQGLDKEGQLLLEEDLKSPCTEEIAVFRAFAEAVSAGKNKFVVLDTAPTGHTILLLDSALAYHREVTRQSHQMPEAVESLLPRLRDPAFTRVLIITLPEATPVHEAASLQKDLRRAGIEPFAWVINQALLPLALTDPILTQRRQHQDRFVSEVLKFHAHKAAIIPWRLEPPVGIAGLSALGELSIASY